MNDFLIRDENGLPVLGDLKIPVKNGFVDWRGLVDDEHLYVNSEWFNYRNMPIPESVKGLGDHQLSIKLSGIKELARLRGFLSVAKKISHVSPSHVVASCKISWIPNIETNFNPVDYEEFASATSENTDDFGKKFLETVACNRAFVRSVRNFLNIHIVGFDELPSKGSRSPEEEPSSFLAVTPQNTLIKLLSQKNINSFTDFQNVLRDMWRNKTYKNNEASSWQDFKDIPPKECLKILALLKKES